MKKLIYVTLIAGGLISCKDKQEAIREQTVQAVIKIQKKDYKRAVAILDSAIMDSPDYPHDVLAYKLRGDAKFNQADTVGACEDWRMSDILDQGSNLHPQARTLYERYCQ